MSFDDPILSVDLRMLLLLHAMRDVEGFEQEARRLKEAQPIDDSTWRHICDLGRELNVVIGSQRDSLRSEDNVTGSFDRRQHNRRRQVRRALTDRRTQDRRTATVIWLGQERREQDRRQYARRQG